MFFAMAFCLFSSMVYSTVLFMDFLSGLKDHYKIDELICLNEKEPKDIDICVCNNLVVISRLTVGLIVSNFFFGLIFLSNAVYSFDWYFLADDMYQGAQIVQREAPTYDLEVQLTQITTTAI